MRTTGSQKPIVADASPEDIQEPIAGTQGANTEDSSDDHTILGDNSWHDDSLAEVSPPPTMAENDLLERIRNGFSFPEFNSKHTKRYEKWNSQHPTYLNNLFERAEPFLFHIIEEIEKRGLPTEIALLPAIESAYKPNAMSRSKAGGLWQFIPSTGKYFGLRQDWWYDGRHDLVASTDAALDYLEQLNKMFDGDWYKTLAAYNAGPGTLQKAIKANQRKRKKTDYQSLNLRRETVNYVPKLIALKNIINDPQKFGVSLPKMPNQAWFSVISLPGQIDLHDFASQANIELASLQHLNAGFRRWASSPDGPHRLLVPISHLEASSQALDTLKTAPKINYQNHSIKRGDTLSSIAQRYDVSVSSLKNVNKLSGSSIREGRNLLIPIAFKPEHGRMTRATTRASTSPSIAQAGLLASTPVHRVVAGDTLWSIAKRYRVKVTELVSWNQISSQHILSLDQILKVVPH